MKRFEQQFDPTLVEQRPEASPCWTTQGVYGDSTCPQLKEFVHCRNCPVYSQAGVQLLNRPSPPEYRQEWTEHFAKPRTFREQANYSAILFRLQFEWLALPTHVIQEVAEPRPIHSLPHRRRGNVLGLANVRGELLICVSLGHFLRLEGIPLQEELRLAHHRLLVANWAGQRLGFPVDEVHGPRRFHLQALTAPPATLGRAYPTYTQHILYWQGLAAGVLEADRLFSNLNRSLA